MLTKSWSAKKVQQVFGVSEYLAWQSKKLVKESGIPSLSRELDLHYQELLPAWLHAEKIYYFSDDAASQYKSRKNFLNLCCHQDDFVVKADWLLYMEMGHVMVWVE